MDFENKHAYPIYPFDGFLNSGKIKKYFFMEAKNMWFGFYHPSNDLDLVSLPII